MRRQLNRTRLFVSQWYFGAGNKISVFTRRPKRPFAEYRKIYLREIHSLDDPENNGIGLTTDQKLLIRDRIRKDNIKYWIKTGLIMLLSISIFIGLIILINYFIGKIKYFA